MNIKSIDIHDFRNLHDVTLSNFGSAILFGRNGAGKSSIIEAIRYVLFGYCTGTDKRGAHADQLIQHGATQARIEVVLGFDDRSEIAVGAEINMGKRPNTWAAIDTETGEIIAKNRDELWRALCINMRHALVAAMPEAFLLSEDLGDILAELLAGNIKPERMQEACGDRWPEFEAWLTANNLACRTAHEIEAIGALAEQQRRDLNRELKRVKAEIEVVPPTPRDANGTALTAASRTSLESIIGSVERRLAELNRELGAAQAGGRPQAEVELVLSELDQVIQGYASLIDDAQERIAKLTKAGEGFERSVRAAHNAVANATTTRDLLIVTADEATQRVTDLDGMTTCPTCQAKLSETRKKSMRAPLESLRADAVTALYNAEAALVERTEALAAIDQLADVNRFDLKQAEDALREAENNDRDALYEVAMLRASIYTGRPAAEIEAEIATTQSRIARGRELLAQLEHYIAYQENDLYVEYATKQAAFLDWIVKGFRDGAIVKELLGSGIDEFVGRCNVQLEPFGYSSLLRIEGKSVELQLNRDGEEWTPARLCSKGEQTLAQFAIARAFANTGAPVVLIDNVNELDSVHRKALAEWVRTQTGTVIQAAAWQMREPLDGPGLDALNQALAPIRAYWVEDGAVT
jgi:DNA repair exonuclease SbcCD ATPase subunit